MSYYEELEAELAEPDPLADYEFAVFWSSYDNRKPFRGPWVGTDGLEWCQDWMQEKGGGVRPGALKIRQRKISNWEDIDG